MEYEIEFNIVIVIIVIVVVCYDTADIHFIILVFLKIQLNIMSIMNIASAIVHNILLAIYDTYSKSGIIID